MNYSKVIRNVHTGYNLLIGELYLFAMISMLGIVKALIDTLDGPRNLRAIFLMVIPTINIVLFFACRGQIGKFMNKGKKLEVSKPTEEEIKNHGGTFVLFCFSMQAYFALMIFLWFYVYFKF